MFFKRKHLSATPTVFAAVDLGSNSFHLIVAQLTHGQLSVLDRLRETVRLGEGLDENKLLRPEVQQRALDCLHRFGQRLRSVSPGGVRVVGTSTLRVAKNSAEFVAAAQQALGHPVDIIAGREEARLIYLGVANALEVGEEKRLVVDIGGGSTEIITGHGFKLSHRESLHVGCVGLATDFLAKGKLKRKKVKATELAAELSIQPVAAMFRHTGWDRAIGCSGTIRAIQTAVQEQGWSDQGITHDSLRKLRTVVADMEDTEQLKELGVVPERRPIFMSGLAILWAVFELLRIERMDVSDQALREGVLYDLIGRVQHTDVRENTVQSLIKRWAVDEKHAVRVRTTANSYLMQVAKEWVLEYENAEEMLNWAALSHEIGLLISHGQYHKHGSYVIGNADLSGFSRQDQSILAALVRGHRRKFPVEVFQNLSGENVEPAKRLSVLLRVAVLMHRGRSENLVPDIRLTAKENILHLDFPAGWLEQNPLTLIDLEQEARYLRMASITLTFAG